MRDEELMGVIQGSLAAGVDLRRALRGELAKDIAKAARVVIEAIERGATVFFFGNGGSAADAQHMAAELVGRLTKERPPLRAIALTVDTSALTCIGNDYGFDHVFSRQLQALARPGDVAVAITTSGKSKNVLVALEAARNLGLRVVGLTGGRGREFAAACDAAVVVPSSSAARIQECHITIGHILCEAVDAALFFRAEHHPTDALVLASPRASSSLKEVDRKTLIAMRREWKAQGLSVVWTNGAFDVLHAGHLRSLTIAKSFGDVLVVGVNADAAVRRAKGATRPVFPVAERVELLAGLEVVDWVLVFDEDTPEVVLGALQPDVHCKGGEYRPPNGKPIPEAEVVRAYGGRIEFVEMVPGRSTTSTLAELGR